MIELEDRIRAATRAAAATVAEGSAPPLRPSADGGEFATGRSRIRRRADCPSARRFGAGQSGTRRPAWVAPVGAAASVIAVLAAALLATGALGQGTAHRPTTAASHRTAAGHHRPPLRPAPPIVDGLPAYFLSLGPDLTPGQGGTAGEQGDGQTADIRFTATGQVAATANLPGGGLTRIAAGGDGTFYAAVRQAVGTRIYAIKVPSRGTRAIVTRLPITVPTPVCVGTCGAMAVNQLAAAPDDRLIAFTTDVQHGDGSMVQRLTVASVTTGAQRTWTTPASAAGGSMTTISWLGDSRTLAINWEDLSGGTPAAASSSLRLLNTAAPGTSLLSSRAILPLVTQAGQFGDLLLSPDGRIAMGTEQHPAGLGTVQGQPVAQGSAIRFVVATGQPTVSYAPPAVRYTPQPLAGMCNDPLWLSQDGQRALLMCIRLKPEGKIIASIPYFVVLSHLGQAQDKVTVLPWLARFGPDSLAFGG